MRPVRRTLSRWCLVTDIDGTLIGDRATTRSLRDAVLRERDGVEARGGRLYWVIATGRHRDDTCDVLLEHGFLPSDFDALVTAVGAELHHRSDELARHEFPLGMDTRYAERLFATGFDPTLVRNVLEPLSFLGRQPDHEQVPHKVSYFAPDTEEYQAEVARALSTLPFRTQTVWSHDHYLDVAPHNGAKGGAVDHLIEHWQLDAEAVVAAGDSGNDHSMLARHWSAIVVGNGHRALHTLRGRTGVYFARRDFAAGVLEGLRALGFVE
jgi:sucrose-phosphate synthase